MGENFQKNKTPQKRLAKKFKKKASGKIEYFWLFFQRDFCILREARENVEHFWHIFKGISLFEREAPENFGCF